MLDIWRMHNRSTVNKLISGYNERVSSSDNSLDLCMTRCKEHGFIAGSWGLILLKCN